MERRQWKRVLFKTSGEALAPASSCGINATVVQQIAADVVRVVDAGTQVALLPGGGNIWRGATGAHEGMERSHADYMGMLATAINALALQDAIERLGLQTRVMSAIEMTKVAEPYIRRRAMRHLEKGRVVIFACGTGNPFFTTDTAGALRAVEIEAEVLLKGTHSGVDGVYTADPRSNAEAIKLDSVTYQRVLDDDLRVMDLTAITFCKDNDLPIIVFDMMTPGNLDRVIMGEQVGTIVS